jgi:hypothetical protein
MCFTNYASTKELGSKKGNLLPLTVKLTASTVFKEIKKYLNDSGYEEVVAREDYLDLFGVKNDFEISINIVSSEGKSFISISCYCEKRRFTTKKTLINVYNELENLFERYR